MIKLTEAEALRGIAHDIETHGHYQSSQHPDQRAYSPVDNPTGPCCLIINPTRKGWGAHMTFSVSRLYDLLQPELGSRTLSQFSDETPTEELVALLRRRADELEA